MSTNTGNGRVAIVTGGSRGIGRRTAERLASEGIAVVVNYAASDKEADAVVAEITSHGGEAVAVRGDVADEQAMAAVFDLAERTFGGVDILVNAAGRLALAPLADLDLQVLDSLHRTNVRGTFVVNQQAARRLRPGGSIVNFSTSVLGTAAPAYSAYVASKGAVEGLTLILARELRGRDVTVNAVAPGPTATDLFLNGKEQQEIDRLAHAVPLERLGTPGDIAELVAFLTSPAGHWVNGQNIRVNGGLV
ncbi:SDR family oxidoreductase [Streptomyces sp. NPDC007148]|uniref:SDR family oxidoreductase n=1 Tax=Streptomyces sp. NPDC007148 TaxID=3364775 RepID=UPI0036945168